ncbi:type IX secretion system anionic LPS delivery protein PorZ [Psychroserpens ponticola]|uniref:Two-component regulator propeller domain-containing protein n=1 Tax=Psychroserpens ponticola TaxID=2932268 RepID=A0ABY7RWN0_9FLAO|nr:two-component regulator propeller domain-containing protein [Psychroserpens ponticola]WCO01497.1 two-component regulator propeller domain-containing protein [Psychroserpens ponticola]
MKRYFTIIFSLFILAFNTLSAQDFSSLWTGHFSYLNIKDFSNSPDLLFAASENAVFTLEYATNTLEEISTINGLSGETISTIYFSDSNDLLFIGYETGLINIVSVGDNEVISVIDILNKVTIPPNLKRINHFYEDNGLVYISTDFGISVYDLDRLEFGDTYFIGSGGTQIKVNQTTVFGDFIYAACGDNSAIKKADIFNPNLINFSEWQTISSGNFIGIQGIDDKLYSIRDNGIIYRLVSDNLNQLFTYPEIPVDIRTVNSDLIVTTPETVYVYDSDFNSLATATTNTVFDTVFTAATINDQDELFIGTNGLVSLGKPGYGVLKASFNDPTNYEEIHPDGPLKNSVFSIETPPNEIWAVFGGYSRTFNTSGATRRSGISHFKNNEWINTPYDSILAVIPNPVFLSDISVNPFNTNQVFISSYSSGLLEILDEVPVMLYNQNNSTLIPFAGDFKLTTASVFDRNGALWVMNGRVPKPLNKFENGVWTSYDFTPIIPVPPSNSNLGFTSIVVNDQKSVFTGTFSFGLVGFNEDSSQLSFASGEAENFPSPNVRSLAFDNNGQLWIGTEKGLRILFSPPNFFSNPNVNNIVILEEGIPKELLSSQLITAITVDGSNNKWVGTAGSGLFYFSPDGQETIFHFTTNNSPLPVNTINDVSIDSETGRVYIATSKGMVSFSSGGTKTEESLDQAFVYPNPVRPEYNILGSNNLNDINKGVKISNLTENVNIKITDIEGNLVAEAQSTVNKRSSKANYNFAIDGGTAIWNGKNLANNVVATGVYLIFISDLDSFETKILKLLIVR